MSNILHITASIREEESVTRRLGGRLVEALAGDSNATVVVRDLARNDLPFIDAERFAANLTPEADRSEAQQAIAEVADRLIEELQVADTIVLSLPVYNFAMPSSAKVWADLVARAGTTFKYTESGPVGMLENKRAYIVVASGGTAVGGPIDFLTPWLRHFLGFIGITDVEVIAADGIMGLDGAAKIDAATHTIEWLAA